MRKQFMRRAARLAVVALSLSVGLGTAAVAAESAREKALAVAANAPALKWGACPALFPTGCEIAVLHGDSAQPNADVFLRVPAKYEIPPHWHTSAERMVLVAGELHVTYQGQPVAIMKPGTCAYGPAKAPHKASCASSDTCVLFIAFESAVDAHAFNGSLK
jgi:mannose-6-phosphate isomerase-like protein (cupin superfamily)